MKTKKKSKNVETLQKNTLGNNPQKTSLISLKDCQPNDKPFVDERGIIQNLITTGVASVAIISTKKGGVRSNHYHLENSHWLFIVSGKVEYYERSVGVKNDKIMKVFSAGEMFYTPPMKVHKVVALEDCVMISMAPQSNAALDHDLDTIKEDF